MGPPTGSTALLLFRFAPQTRTCRGEAPPSCYARPFCRLKAPLGLSLLRFAAQTRTFENTSLLAACKKNQGKLWQKERKLNGASPLDKVLLRNVVPSRFCPGFKKGLHSIIYHAIMLPEIESRIFRAGCDSLPVVQPTSRKA